MFHTHKASMSLDKIYALIGMSFDGSKQSSLTPDYKIPFQEVFGKLIRYLIPGQISVTTQNEGAAAIIKGEGRFIGCITDVEPIVTENEQVLEMSWYGQSPRRWGFDWSVLAPAVPLRKFDLVYLFPGLSTLTILRIHGSIVVVLATTAFCPSRITKYDIEALHEMHQRPLTMIWDWDYSPDDLDRVQSYNL